MTQISNIESEVGEHHTISEVDLNSYKNRIIYLLDENDRRIGKLFVYYCLSDYYSGEIIPADLTTPLSHYDARFSTLDTLVIRKGKAALCRLEYPLDLS